MIEKAPLIFKPYLKKVIWGGTKICTMKGIHQKEPNIGESWEVSAIPGHESVVAEGKYKDRTITDLIEEFGADLLGERVFQKYDGKFPLLVKIIDANDKLSVQVHPDDNLAKKRHSSPGKTEMWYIISTEPDAKVYAGFKIRTDPDDYIRRIANGTFIETLAEHDSHPGDIFYLPPGRVHTIGAGNLLAEIQESSDITYRIYDYDRKDALGNKRELHTSEAKDAIDYNLYDDYKYPPVDDSQEIANLVNCEHFKTYRIKVTDKKDLSFNPDSFTVLMCLEGEMTLIHPVGSTSLKEGMTVLIPAALTNLRVTGEGKLLMANS